MANGERTGGRIKRRQISTLFHTWISATSRSLGPISRFSPCARTYIHARNNIERLTARDMKRSDWQTAAARRDVVSRLRNTRRIKISKIARGSPSSHRFFSSEQFAITTLETMYPCMYTRRAFCLNIYEYFRASVVDRDC